MEFDVSDAVFLGTSSGIDNGLLHDVHSNDLPVRSTRQQLPNGTRAAEQVHDVAIGWGAIGPTSGGFIDGHLIQPLSTSGIGLKEAGHFDIEVQAMEGFGDEGVAVDARACAGSGLDPFAFVVIDGMQDPLNAVTEQAFELGDEGIAIEVSDVV